jgi:signal transduction histidine kinase
LLDNDIAAVQRLDIVPTILETVCGLTGMGFAAVARVTEDRWIACAVVDNIEFGLPPGGELKLDTTICDEIRQSGIGVVIPDVQADPVFCNHHTPALYGFRSYISLPIVRSDGSFFGTLCAIDPEPRDLARPEIESTFRLFAALLAIHLDSADRLAASEGKLATEVQSSERREQFIAVIGHDLRNPLAAIDAGLAMLRKDPEPARSAMILDQMHRSVKRMFSLVDDILDFARGRLGGGIGLNLQIVDLTPVVHEVAAELAVSHPDQKLVVQCDPGPILVRCDVQRIGQLLSNLLGNAFTHGAKDQPITISSSVHRDRFELSVSNGGKEIPPAEQARLFQPFARGRESVGREGLGLGLFISSEIAKAHGGQLSVASTAEQTRFTFSLPL